MTDLSIVRDVDKLINKALGLKKGGKYQTKTTCQLLSKRQRHVFDVEALIQKILSRVTSNWDGEKSRSKENWRWKQNPKISTKSEEVILERWIVRTAKDKDWANQVPVASGLTPSAAGRRAIDLVHRCRDGWYEFIELKVDERSGRTPLFAAMEILQYGVLYIFSREKASALGYKETGILGATDVNLKVLAPTAYYEGYDLSWLEGCINIGLAKFLAQRERGFKMNFKFEFLSRSPVTWKVSA